MLSYMKNLFISLKEVFIFLFGQVLSVFVVSICYALFFKGDVNNFLNFYGAIIYIIINIIFIQYFIKRYKLKFNFEVTKKYFLLLLISICLPLLLNSIIYYFNLNQFGSNNSSLWIIIIGSVLIGPTLEELVFRNLLNNNLIKFNSINTTIFISSLIFGLCHFDPIKSVYAFIIGLFLNTLYFKNKNIMECIFCHMIMNLMSIFIVSFNIYIFLFSLISCFISLCLLSKEL